MEAEKKQLIKISDKLYEASKHIRILRNVSWSSTVREEFLASKGENLPVVSYPKVDVAPAHKYIAEVRKLIPSDFRFANWANAIADTLSNSAEMLTHLGKPEFYTYSQKLYGTPKNLLPDGKSTSLDLASFFEEIYDNISLLNLPHIDEKYDAVAIHDRMVVAVEDMFGPDAPAIIIDDEVSSKVIAGRRRIRIRSNAFFSDMDIDQLIHHEAYIHVATSINGHAQDKLKILSASHPGTTKTQEGLAVFAEFITGHLDLDRLRRLSDRIIAVQMAVDGADFIEVFRFYKEKTDNDANAYENTRRVFRGGVLTGGAPFTKDIVYLDGLLNVHNFLRTMVGDARADVLPLLFSGKLDIEDMGEMIQFKKMGLLKDPLYLPPWIKDIRFLLTYLSYSSFLNSVKLDNMKDHYRKMVCDL